MPKLPVILLILSATTVSFLSACNKTESPKLATSDVKVQTVTYYINHYDETLKQYPICVNFANSEYSLMTSEQKKQYDDSPPGINCHNVIEGKGKGWALNQMRKGQEAYDKANPNEK